MPRKSDSFGAMFSESVCEPAAAAERLFHDTFFTEHFVERIIVEGKRLFVPSVLLRRAAKLMFGYPSGVERETGRRIDEQVEIKPNPEVRKNPRPRRIIFSPMRCALCLYSAAARALRCQLRAQTMCQYFIATIADECLT